MERVPGKPAIHAILAAITFSNWMVECRGDLLTSARVFSDPPDDQLQERLGEQLAWL